MSIDAFDPNVEPPHADESARPRDGHGDGEPAAPSVDPIPHPAAEGISSTSGDDLTVSLTHARPDPLLVEFVTEGSPQDGSPAPADHPPEIEAGGQGPHRGSRADAMNALAGLALGKDIPAIGPGLSLSSSEALTRLMLALAGSARRLPSQTPALWS